MTATITKLRLSVSRLECSTCGAPGEGSCNCGTPYLPAGARAAEAVKANPGKSDRAIAEEVGVSLGTVQRARKAGDSYESPEERTGKDGKSYPATPKRQDPEVLEASGNDEPTPEDYRIAFLMRVDAALKFAAFP